MHFMHIKHVSTNTKFVVFDFYENKHTHNLCVVGTDTHADHKLNRIDTFRHCIWHILLAYGHTSYRIYSIHNYYTRFFLLLFVDFSVMINILVLILIRFEKKCIISSFVHYVHVCFVSLTPIDGYIILFL